MVVRNAESRPPPTPDLMNQNLHFNKKMGGSYAVDKATLKKSEALSVTEAAVILQSEARNEVFTTFTAPGTGMMELGGEKWVKSRNRGRGM